MWGFRVVPILFLSAILIVSSLPIGVGLPKQQEQSVPIEPREPHDPILILGEGGFTPSNGVTGGSGTVNDPYIIEGWEIDASTAHGIKIVNTTAHFIIRNCLVQNGGNAYHGIYLHNVQNGQIKNTTTSNNNYGIYLLSSNNNILTNNIVSNNSYYGIHLGDSSNNTLNNNTVSYNFFHGIDLEGQGIYNTITNNIVSNNGEGIYDWTSYNTIINNIVSNNDIGIHLCDSGSNTITNNTVENNGTGIFLDGPNNVLTGNTVINNSSYGIKVWIYSSNLIYNNYFSNLHNAWDIDGNTWNIDPIPGPNIVGGSWLGGNYWSDYAGVDLDGDGLGDTGLPYNSSGEITNGGDYQSLVSYVEPPNVAELDLGPVPGGSQW